MGQKRKPLDAKAESIKYLKRCDYEAATVERFVQQIKQRFDLFGVFDVLAFDDDRTIGVQVTTASNAAAHFAKLNADARCRRWINGPMRYAELHVWRRAAPPLHPKHRLTRYRFSKDDGRWLEVK